MKESLVYFTTKSNPVANQNFNSNIGTLESAKDERQKPLTKH